jgi:hypothetical protein
MTPERTEAAVAPDDDLRDIEMLVADLDSHVRVGRKHGDLVDQLVSHHRAHPLGEPAPRLTYPAIRRGAGVHGPTIRIIRSGRSFALNPSLRNGYAIERLKKERTAEDGYVVLADVVTRRPWGG